MKRGPASEKNSLKAGEEYGAVAIVYAPPLVELDQPLDEREPDAEAALATIEAALALHEELEHARQELGVDAAAVVLDRDGSDAFAGHGGKPDAPALAGVLGSVVQQVGDHLREARKVA